MKSINTRSRMNKSEQNKNLTGSKCHKPNNQTGIDNCLCKEDASPSTRKSTRYHTYKSNRLNKKTDDIVLVESSSEEESNDPYYADIQPKLSIKKGKTTTSSRSKDFSDQDYADEESDTYAETSLINKRQTKKNIPSTTNEVDSLHVSTLDNKSEKSNGLVYRYSSDSSTDEYENYHAKLKELRRSTSPNQEKHIAHSTYKGISNKIDRVSKKPLHMIGPSDDSSSTKQNVKPSNLIEKPTFTRKTLPKRVTKVTSSNQSSSTSNSRDTDQNTRDIQGSSSGSPKLKLKLYQQESNDSSSIDKDFIVTTRSQKPSAASKTKPMTSDKQPLDMDQKTPKRPKLKLKCSVAESSSSSSSSSSRKPAAPNSARLSPKAKPETLSSWKPLDIGQGPTVMKSKRRLSVTRRARVEPYAAATSKRKLHFTETEYLISSQEKPTHPTATTDHDTSVFSQEKVYFPTAITTDHGFSHARRRSSAVTDPEFDDFAPVPRKKIRKITHQDTSSLKSHVARSQRRSTRKKPESIQKKPFESHEIITLSDSSDKVFDPIIKPTERRSSRRKSSLLSDTSELAIGATDPDQWNTLHNGTEHRYKTRKRSRSIASTSSSMSHTVNQAADNASFDVYQSTITNTRTLRNRSSSSAHIELFAGAPIIVVPEVEQIVNKEEESDSEVIVNVDLTSRETEEESDEDVSMTKEASNEDEPFIDYLDMIKTDPAVGTLRIKKEDLIISEKVLGEGQAGIVYAGTYRGLPVACKTKRNGVNEDDFYFQIFKEISFAYKLTDCRYSIDYFGWVLYDNDDEEDDNFYLIQRRIDNGDARRYLFERGTFYPQEVLAAGISLFSTLSDVHDADIGVVDLKLENYLIDNSGSGYLTDFGSCVEFLGRETVNLDDEEVPWTKSVAAPEMVSVQQFSKASDVFMGTVILAELMTAELTDSEFKNKVLRRKAGGTVDFCSKEINDCYRPFFGLLAKGLQKNALNRPSAKEMLSGLLAVKNENLPLRA